MHKTNRHELVADVRALNVYSRRIQVNAITFIGHAHSTDEVEFNQLLTDKDDVDF